MPRTALDEALDAHAAARDARALRHVGDPQLTQRSPQTPPGIPWQQIHGEWRERDFSTLRAALRNERVERPVKLLVGLLGVASLAEVLSLVNQAWPVPERPLVTVIEILILIAAALIAARLVFRTFRRTSE